MTFPEAALLFLAALWAGAQNAVAGGGSFISFPALVATRLTEKIASATNTVGLWPGSVASVGGFRKELARLDRLVIVVLSVVSIVGGYLGAKLLLGTKNEDFARMIPFLLLLATLLFAFGPTITKQLQRRGAGGNATTDKDAAQAAASVGTQVRLPATQSNRTQALAVNPNQRSARPSWLALGVVVVLQIIIAVYGGLFGAGIGILMLAAFSVLGMEHIHNMNALKTLLATFINGTAALTLALSGVIVWPQALIMMVGATIGGYAGAAISQRIDPKLVRRVVIVIATGITILFFIKNYLTPA